MDYKKAYEELRKEVELQKKQIRLIKNIAAIKNYNLGNKYFSTLLKQLNKAIEADYTFVGQINNNLNVDTLVICSKEGSPDNFSYTLNDTPCENVVGKKLCTYPENVTKLFPKDLLLQELNIEGYIGIPLFNSKHEANGILVSLFKNPVSAIAFAETIFLIFANQIGIELDYRRILTDIETNKNILMDQNDMLEQQNKKLKKTKNKLHKANDKLEYKNKLLEESERKYRLLFENMTSGFALFEMIPDKKNKPVDYKFLEINPAFEKLTGLNTKKLIKDTIKNIFPEIKDIWMNILGQIALTTNSLTYEYNSSKSDKYYSIYAFSPQKNQIAVLFNNITEQKLSQLALNESEMRFKQLSDLAFEGILVHKNGIAININNALLKMTGYSREELLGKNLIEFLIPKKYHAMMYENMKSPNAGPYEIDLKTKNGETVYIELSAKKISENDEELRVVSIRDITEQKEMQNKILSAIINTEEQERKRIAQELHDGLGPILSMIKLYTETYFNSNDTEFKNKIQEQLIIGINDALEQISTTSNNLSPHVLDDFGLNIAIEKFIEKIKKVSNLRINYCFDYQKNIYKDIEITLYRIVTELINNTLKHAGATSVDIKITAQMHNISLSYSDDGIGFNLEKTKNNKRGMGLFNIENRIKSLGGNVIFKQGNEKGICFEILIPVENTGK